jgi:hypothetical protein
LTLATPGASLAALKELDPRLALAFNAHRTRLWRVVLARALTIAGLLALALYTHHWGAWTAFGVIGFMQAAGLIALVLVSRMPDRLRARLEVDERELAWLHAAPEPRTKLHRVELHDREGDLTALFVPAAIARGATEAARELAHAPTVTTDDAARAAVEPRQRLLGKLVQLERAASTTAAPKLAQHAATATAAVAAWRRRLFPPLAHPYRAEPEAAGTAADVEARLDKLLHLYASAKLGEGHRVKVEAIERAKNLPEGILTPELFTAEIAALLDELHAHAMAVRPDVDAGPTS